QLRLLANMLDGLVAVEGGRKTATGDLFNEVPDRFADVLILASAGYALSWLGTLGITFGWLVAVLAVLSAYVRVFGGSLGFQQSFTGPMAKQHRMAILTLACLAYILERIGPGRRFPADRGFNGLLVDQVAPPGTGAAGLRRQAVDHMGQAPGHPHPVLLFPEGNRGAGEDLAPFRSGLYHLCRTRPEIEVIPVYLENLNRILPKGHLLPVPMLSRITFGAPLHLQPAEEKDAFLERARQAVRALKEAA